MTPGSFTYIAGISGSASVFAPVASLLRDRGWIVSLIEHGSAPADVDDLVRRVRAAQHPHRGPTVVCGESFGGIVAQTFARAFPDELSHLVLVSTFAHLHSPASHAFVQAIAPLASRIARYAPPTTASALRRLVGTTVNPTDPPALRKAYRDAETAPLHVYVDNVRTALAFDARPYLPSLASPTLVVHGADDRLIPVARGRELARLIPRATLDIVPNAGHLPHVAFPDRFVARLDHWVTG
jgi:pimeloyl-ACP methyl ester carboxylesterase